VEEIKTIQKKQDNKQPSNLEAEQALLGSILVNNDIIDEVSSLISSNIFYDPAHVKIYEVIESLNNKGMIANPITLKNFFEKDNMLNEVGGTEYLVKLTRFSGSTKQAVDYAKIIHEMYLRRELVLISDKLSSDTLNANSQEQDAENIIEDTEKSLFDLAERGSFSQSFLKFNQALDQTIQMATLAMQNDQGIVGVPTGLSDLDEKLGGLHKSDLIILAGRPSMGKTALATNIAYNAAQNILKRQEKILNSFFLFRNVI
jgi:replicative DNA helicase